VCIITHACLEGAVVRALGAIEKQPFMRGRPRLIRIEEV